MSSTMHMHGGIGESIKRKEDGRFLRGKGNYLDDFVLPNMMHMAILRSPYAHARIRKIDTEAAAALTLEFSRGTLGAVMVSFRAEYRTPIEVVGETGVLRASDALNVERPINLELLRAGAVVETETLSNHLAYARQVDEFAAAVEGKSKFPVPGEEGWQNQLILDAAYRSLKNGKVEEVQKLAGGR